MRLLSPKENKDSKDEQTLRNILRTQELNKAETKARLELANTQAEFNLTLSKNREQWAKEEEDHVKRVQEMRQEIDVLEAKRMNAMIPVDILKQSAEEQLIEAETYIKGIREREEYNNDLTEKLQDRLDEVNGKDQDLLKKEKELLIREDGIERQNQSTIFNSESLTQKIQEFYVLKESADLEIVNKNNALSLLEQSLDEKDKELKQLQESVNAQSLRLADERGVLERAWNELRRKQANILIDK